jgi:hypothetical protein
MAITDFGTNDPLGVNLWSKSIDVDRIAPAQPRTLAYSNRLSTLIMLPDDGVGGLQPLALPPPGCCSARGYSPCTHNMGK